VRFWLSHQRQVESTLASDTRTRVLEESMDIVCPSQRWRRAFRVRTNSWRCRQSRGNSRRDDGGGGRETYA
jgi:hypothetical protein